MLARRTAFALALLAVVPAAGQPVLLQDVAPGGFELPASPRDFVSLDDVALFTLDLPHLGRELWRSDGSEAGTYLVADLCSGPCSIEMTPLGWNDRLLLFHAHGSLWTSDGTREGTRRLMSQAQARRVRFLGGLERELLFVSEGVLYSVGPRAESLPLVSLTHPAFDPVWSWSVADDRSRSWFFSEGSLELWTSDGTPGGTFPLPAVEGPLWGVRALAGGGALVWERERLWHLDRPGAAPRQIATFQGVLREPPLINQVHVGSLVEDGERAFFTVSWSGGARLWVTDATAVGTRELTNDVRLSAPMLSAGRLAYMTGDRLWIGDGTVGGSRQVERPCGGTCRWSRLIAGFDDGFLVELLRGDHFAEQAELWWTDGRPGGPRRLLEVAADRFGSFTTSAQQWPIGDHLVLLFHGRLLEVRPGLRALDHGRAEHSEGLARAGGWLLFTPDGDLWRWDGAGVERVAASVASGGASSEPGGLTPIGERLCAWMGPPFRSGHDLWCGTLSGGFENVLGLGAEGPGVVLPLARGHLFASAGELWVAERLAGFAEPVIESHELVAAVRLDGRAVFAAGGGLWTSDGTVAGTRLYFGGLERTGYRAVELAGRVLFRERFGATVWATDGTADGTLELELPEGFSTFDPIVERGGLGWFLSAPDDELWRTDGTPAGTVRQQALDADAGWRLLSEPGAGLLFLVRRGPVRTPEELWVTDGHAPPRHVATLDSFESASAWDVLGTPERLWLVLDDGVHGRELWVSDGTAAGTRLVADLWPGKGSSSPQNLRAIGDRLYFAANDGVHGSELWLADDLGVRRLTDLAPGADSSFPSGMTAIADQVVFAADDGIHGRELWSLPLAAAAPSACEPSATRLCLGGGRFAVTVHWRDQINGGEGAGRAVPLTGSAESGVFWFFDPGNVELIVKVLDGRPVNGHHWVFYGALSTVEYWIDVLDTATGTARRYHNPPGEQCGRGDTSAFAAPAAPVSRPLAAPPAPAPAAVGTASVCGEGALCLLGGRFAVEVEWHDPRSGHRGAGAPIPGSDNSGYFWFFDAANVELVVKLLDAAAVDGHRWFFYGGLSDVEYEVRVTDTATGAERVYRNPFGEICGGSDTRAFVAEASGGSAR